MASYYWVCCVALQWEEASWRATVVENCWTTRNCGQPDLLLKRRALGIIMTSLLWVIAVLGRVVRTAECIHGVRLTLVVLRKKSLRGGWSSRTVRSFFLLFLNLTKWGLLSEKCESVPRTWHATVRARRAWGRPGARLLLPIGVYTPAVSTRAVALQPRKHSKNAISQSKNKVKW